MGMRLENEGVWPLNVAQIPIIHCDNHTNQHNYTGTPQFIYLDPSVHTIVSVLTRIYRSNNIL